VHEEGESQPVYSHLQPSELSRTCC
jgi:hypothetical protein